MTNTWFNVDKKGLAKLLEQRGKAFAVFELVQNAWDAEGGCYGNQTMHINVVKFDKHFFHEPTFAASIGFICHKLAHHYGNHLEVGYHEALERFAGELTSKALREPKFFKV